MDTILKLVAEVQDQSFPAGHELLKEGESSDLLYILSEGEVEIVKGGERICSVRDAGALLGEIGALMGLPHMATARAFTPVRAKVVSDVKSFLRKEPEVCREVAETLAWRLVETSNFLADQRQEFMRRSKAVNVSAAEDASGLERFTEYWHQSWKLFERQHYEAIGLENVQLKYEQFLPGETILRQGVKDEKLLILRTGSVEVLKNETPLFMVWDRGVLFGEISALLGTGHTASVRALEPCTFQVVESAEKLFHAHVDVAWFVARLLAKRLLDANRYFVGLKQQFHRMALDAKSDQATQLLTFLEHAAKELQLRHHIRPRPGEHLS
ncbi:MAG: hypothetical protein AMXMBFR7_02190 [Planctomycetota bacterium]